jgi:hypothetical protein
MMSQYLRALKRNSPRSGTPVQIGVLPGDQQERARAILRERGALPPDGVAAAAAARQWHGVDHVDLLAVAATDPDLRLWCGHTAADVVVEVHRRRIRGRRGEIIEREELVKLCRKCQVETT